MIADVTRGLSEWWAPVLAFVAGVVSFASPCVLPLVPGYLAFVSGSGGEEPARTRETPGGEGVSAVAVRERTRVAGRRALLPMALFVVGFAVVFTALGVVVGQFPQSGVNKALHSSLLLRIAGAFVLLFGVAMVLYAFRLGSPALYAERRPLLSRVRPGPAGALPLGMAFALGWTPCIGPVLGVILAIAATQGGGGAFRGGGLLFLYSLGLGVPFLLIGLGVRRLMGALDVIKRNYHWIAGVSGTIMVAIGVLLISGLWESWVTPWLNRLSRVTPPL